MRREFHKWHSPNLGREMDMLVYGHGGAPVLVFPTSGGRFYEYEDFGMVGALAHQINQGWLQLFCVDQVYSETYHSGHWDIEGRLRRHDQYEQYILQEVLPLVRQMNSTDYLIATGCSLGATEAVSFTLRHPGVVKRVIGLSGAYDIKQFYHHHYSEALYFHDPTDFIPNLSDQWRIDRLRETNIILVTGSTDGLSVNSTRDLSAKLWDKGIGNALRVWDGWYHDWPYWHEMINRYIGGND